MCANMSKLSIKDVDCKQNVCHVSFPFKYNTCAILLYGPETRAIQTHKHSTILHLSSFNFMDTQTPSVDGTGTIETSAGIELTLCESDINQEPQEGMLFESEEAAITFYDEYAGRVGFVTRVLSSRKSERGSIISRGLGCKGGSDNQKTETVSVQKRDRRREGCTAMILVKREKPGRWVVRKFVQDHNHSLSVALPKRRPTYDEREKRIQELTVELRVKKRLSAAYREQLLSLMKDVEGHNEHISTKVQVVLVHKNLKELETQRQQLLQRR